MNDDKYFEDLDARKNTFWRRGNEFHAVKECSQCDTEMEEEHYVCIYHEMEQLNAKGC
jgi:hypothetical protein